MNRENKEQIDEIMDEIIAIINMKLNKKLIKAMQAEYPKGNWFNDCLAARIKENLTAGNPNIENELAEHQRTYKRIRAEKCETCNGSGLTRKLGGIFICKSCNGEGFIDV